MRHTTFDRNGNVIATEDFPDDQRQVATVTISDRLRLALAANKTYQAIPSPNAAQQRAQIDKLTRQSNALIRLALGALDDASDT